MTDSSNMYISGSRSKNEYHYRFDIYVTTKLFPAASQKMDIISKNQYYLESKCRLLAADSFVQSRSECANVETFSSTVGQVWRHQVCTHLSKNHVIEKSSRPKPLHISHAERYFKKLKVYCNFKKSLKCLL